MGETATRTDDGLSKVYPSCRPHGTTTYFTGAGDHPVDGIGKGDRLLFGLAVDTPSQAVEITFNEDVYVKDGYMITQGAPFGACLDVEIVHPVAGVVGAFARKVPVLANGWFPMDSDDRSLLPAGMKLRVTVYNSDGVAPQDAAAAFKLAGRIELFRATTI